MSLLIILIILWAAWNLFQDAISLALDAVPKHIDIEEVRGFLLSQPGVERIHDLHIWALSTSQVALTAHLIMSQGHDQEFILNLQNAFRQKFKINHTTFQIEDRDMEEGCETNCE
ncbi:MAG: hypothetical protein GF421_04425 [Candidatus Aminicenantes bacterium]|nr:hypothetical protein [Candidatus Aminicenantes bacterium]